MQERCIYICDHVYIYVYICDYVRVRHMLLIVLNILKLLYHIYIFKNMYIYIYVCM